MKENGKIFHKYSEAKSWIHSILLLLPPGGALPGLREMVRRTGIGRTILEKVLAEAVAGGYLQRRPRSGYYRGFENSMDQADLAILLDNSNGQLDLVGKSPQRASYISRVVLHLQKLSEINRKKLLITENIDDLPANTPCFAVGTVSKSLILELSKLPARQVVISGDCPGELQVLPPKEKNVRSGLDYLYRMGHQRMGMLYFCAADPDKNAHRNPYLFEYYKFMAEHGLKSYPHFLIAFPDEAKIAAQLTGALHHEVRMDSLIVPTCWIETVYRILKQEKMSVPWNISILALGTPGDDMGGKNSLTMLVDQPEKVAEQAWDLMYSDQTEDVIQLTPEIIPGKSVRRRN